jgi:fido (protein-threonine AMPylation protein)
MSFGTSSTSAIHNNLPLFEANATASPLIELDERPLVGRFDGKHLKSIHQHIFQDVYRWAGEFPDRQYLEGRSSLRSRCIHCTCVG